MVAFSFGLFVGYCYDLDYSLIVDIGVSVITVIFLGINFIIKFGRCHRTGLSPVQPHLPLWEGPNVMLLPCLLLVPPMREGYGRALP